MQTNWKISKAPKDKYGFVYKITFKEDNSFYIGSKAFFSITNPKISKKRANELYRGKGRKPVREKKIVESNWKIYTSSSSFLNDMIKEHGIDKFSFEILKSLDTKQEMLLYEAYLISYEFLIRNPKILNQWVSIKSFKI